MYFSTSVMVVYPHIEPTDRVSSNSGRILLTATGTYRQGYS